MPNPFCYMAYRLFLIDLALLPLFELSPNFPLHPYLSPPFVIRLSVLDHPITLQLLNDLSQIFLFPICSLTSATLLKSRISPHFLRVPY